MYQTRRDLNPRHALMFSFGIRAASENSPATSHEIERYVPFFESAGPRKHLEIYGKALRTCSNPLQILASAPEPNLHILNNLRRLRFGARIAPITVVVS